MRKTIEQLQMMRESEDRVEFKKVNMVMFPIMEARKLNLQIEDDVFLDMLLLFVMRKVVQWS